MARRANYFVTLTEDMGGIVVVHGEEEARPQAVAIAEEAVVLEPQQLQNEGVEMALALEQPGTHVETGFELETVEECGTNGEDEEEGKYQLLQLPDGSYIVEELNQDIMCEYVLDTNGSPILNIEGTMPGPIVLTSEDLDLLDDEPRVPPHLLDHMYAKRPRAKGYDSPPKSKRRRKRNLPEPPVEPMVSTISPRSTTKVNIIRRGTGAAAPDLPPYVSSASQNKLFLNQIQVTPTKPKKPIILNYRSPYRERVLPNLLRSPSSKLKRPEQPKDRATTNEVVKRLSQRIIYGNRSKNSDDKLNPEEAYVVAEDSSPTVPGQKLRWVSCNESESDQNAVEIPIVGGDQLKTLTGSNDFLFDQYTLSRTLVDDKGHQLLFYSEKQRLYSRPMEESSSTSSPSESFFAVSTSDLNQMS